MASRYTGKGIKRVDAVAKAQGMAMYAADYQFENMLHISLVRSTCSHGIIKNIDLTEVPKGAMVYTAQDIPNNILLGIINDQPILAADKVRFHGEAVAIVAAESLDLAKQAAALVRVEYEPLEVVEDAKTSLIEQSAKVHGETNLLSDFSHHKGDVDVAFAHCAYILEDKFILPTQDHAYLEPEASVAYMEDECLTVIASTQNVFADKACICHSLNLSDQQVRVKAATVGGGFGGKDGNTTQAFVAIVTHKTGRPSKLVFDREESLCTSYKRHAAEITVKLGFDEQGYLKAFDGEMYLDTGAYASLGPAVLSLGSEHLAGPYVIPNVRIQSYLCYTNKPPAGAMRGFGAPQGAFATESLLNRAAKLMDIDPIELRIRNGLTYGAEGSLGQTMSHTVGLKEALTLLKESDFWKDRDQESNPYVGYGMAAGHMSCGMGKGIPDQAKVEVELTEDGMYLVKIGLVDIGQGSETAFAMLAADALEVELNRIKVVMADTQTTYDCGSTAASRSVFIGGNALLMAIEDLKKQVASGNKPIGIGQSAFPENELTFKIPGVPHSMYTFIVQGVKVEINPISGMVELKEAYGVTEAGKIINPVSMDGQIQGGIAMSTGYALSEECSYNHGVQRQKDFSTYILPTTLDMPRVISKYVESYEQSGPVGLKGAAEAATVALAPAITSAIQQVIDLPVNQLPINPEHILDCLQEKTCL